VKFVLILINMSARSLSDLFLPDKILPGQADSSAFTYELVKTLNSQQMYLQSMEVMKFWLILFLYNIPNTISSCAENRKIIETYFEFVRDSLVFYYKINTSDTLYVATFKILNTFGRFDPNLCLISPKIEETYPRIEIRTYWISVLKRSIAVYGRNCQPENHQIIESSELPEYVKPLQKSCIHQANPWTYDKLNEQLSTYMNNLAEFSKLNIATKLGVEINTSKFVLVALYSFFSSQIDKFPNLHSELQESKIPGIYDALWVHISGVPMMLFQYYEIGNGIQTKSFPAPQSSVLVDETHQKYEILYRDGTFMMRTNTKNTVLNHSVIQSTLFLFPTNVEKLITAIETSLQIVLRNCAEVLLIQYLLGRLIGDKSNGDFYSIFTDKKFSVAIDSFAHILQIDFSSKQSQPLENSNECSYMSNKERYQVTFETTEDNRKLITTKRSVPTRENESNIINCGQQSSTPVFNTAIDTYRNKNSEELFTCPECFGEIIFETLNTIELNYQEAKSAIIGVLSGMFPNYSFFANSLVIHQQDKIDNSFLIDFETAGDFSKVEHSSNYWHYYARQIDLRLKIKIIVIVLGETQDKTVNLDSICIQNDDTVTRNKFATSGVLDQINIEAFKLNNENGLLVSNNEISFQTKDTILFSENSNLRDQVEINRINDLIVYSQLGENIAALCREKLIKLGYSISTDHFGKISQTMVNENRVATQPKTLNFPKQIINSINPHKNTIETNIVNPSEPLQTAKLELASNDIELIKLASDIGIMDVEKNLKPKTTTDRSSSFDNTFPSDQLYRFETALVQKTGRDYAKFQSIKFFVMPDLDIITTCTDLESQTMMNPTSKLLCSHKQVRSEHSMVDLRKKRKFCTPQRPIKFRNGFSLDSFSCAEETLPGKTTNVSCFPSDAMLSVLSHKKPVAAGGVTVLHLGGRMSTAFGRSNSPNIFLGIAGAMTVTGGAKNDIFVLTNYHLEIEGFFDGKKGTNTLMIMHVKEIKTNKRKWTNPLPTVVINGGSLKQDTVMTIYKPDKPNEIIRLMNINRIIGRKNQQEKLLNCGCQIGFVQLNGGTVILWDEVHIPRTKKTCSTGLRVVLDQMTTITIDSDQTRYIELYVPDKGPSNIYIRNSEQTQTSSIVFIIVKKNFDHLFHFQVEYQSDERTRSLIAHFNPAGPALFSIYKLRGPVQLKFDDFTLISEERKHILLKNSDNEDVHAGERLEWSIDDNFITYKPSKGSHTIHHDLMVLDQKTHDNQDSYIHVFEINEWPVIIDLDEAQSNMVNVFDLRALSKSDQFRAGTIYPTRSKAEPGSNSQYDEVIFWFMDSNDMGESGQQDPQELVSIGLNVGRTKSSTYFISDRSLLKVTSEFSVEKITFKNTNGDHVFLVLDQTAIFDNYFFNLIERTFQGEYEIYEDHGSSVVMKECQQGDEECVQTMIFWGFDQQKLKLYGVL